MKKKTKVRLDRIETRLQNLEAEVQALKTPMHHQEHDRDIGEVQEDVPKKSGKSVRESTKNASSQKMK